MGKKSREKQLRGEESVNFTPQRGPKSLWESVLFYLVCLGAALALITPLIFRTQFYFPYVGPKGWFLMACCQLAFFSWLLLAIFFKKYRPKFSKILVVFSLFLLVLILATLFGVDPSRSFWSKFERMTGLLMWLHLFGLFLAAAFTFKTISQWRKLFFFSILVACVILSMFLIVEFGNSAYYEKHGKDIFTFARGGGVTLGNSSFLGSYLVFNIFFAVYLFFTSKKKWLKILLGAFIALSCLALYRAGARAATLAVVGGFALMFLMYLAFYLKPKQKILSRVSKIAFFSAVAVYVLTTVLLFIPFEGNLIRDKFAVAASSARFVNWEMAWKGFFDRPLLGWGPENYDILFTKYFNPCLFTKECGQEVWFDRTHNIVLDVLSQTGILGFFCYLLLFGFGMFVLIKKYFKEKSISFWLLGSFIALPVAYFTQNLTVFDMPATLLLFVLLLAFYSFLERSSLSDAKTDNLVVKRKWIVFPVGLLFVILFWQFVVGSAKTDFLIIQAVRTAPSEALAEDIKNTQGDKAFSSFLNENSKERIAFYKQALETSPLGKYQARDFFVETSQGILRNYIKHFPQEQAKAEIDFLVEEMKKSTIESPLDYRAYLKLAQAYNLYALVGVNKLDLALEIGEKAKELSPDNQQTYWTLAQTYLYGGQTEQSIETAKQAIALQPDYLRSYTVVYEIAQMADNEEQANEIKQQAIDFNPEWESEFVPSS